MTNVTVTCTIDTVQAYDVLAMVGQGQDSIHVEPAGSVPDGTRTDCVTGEHYKIIGRVVAASRMEAHAMALFEFAN